MLPPETAPISLPRIDRLRGYVEDAQEIIADKLKEARGKIISTMEVKFLPSSLSREAAAMISAMGTRNPFSYEDIAARTGRLPDSFHEATTIVPPEEIQKAGGKLGRIAHTSIMEQVIPGPSPEGGDRALAVEGISAVVLLDLAGRMRQAAWEIFSSRAGLLTQNKIPSELDDYPSLKEEYVSVTRRTMEIYKVLTTLATAHFLSVTPRQSGEKAHEYHQRCLSLALDLSRNVTPMSCLNHGTFTFSNALAAQEELTRMWSTYPRLLETEEFCEKTLELMAHGTPTLLRYTGPRDGMTAQQKYQMGLADITHFPDPEPSDKPLPLSLIQAGIVYLNLPQDNSDRLGAAIIKRFSNQSFETILQGVKGLNQQERDRIIRSFLSYLNPYDLPPEELGVIRCDTEYVITVGGAMELIRHRPPIKIGAKLTKDLGYRTDSFWRDNFGSQVEQLYEESFEINNGARERFKNAGLEGVLPYLVQRGDLTRLYTVETGKDMWRMHALRSDVGTYYDLRELVRAKHDYLISLNPEIFEYFPVTYR